MFFLVRFLGFLIKKLYYCGNLVIFGEFFWVIVSKLEKFDKNIGFC